MRTKSTIGVFLFGWFIIAGLAEEQGALPYLSTLGISQLKGTFTRTLAPYSGSLEEFNREQERQLKSLETKFDPEGKSLVNREAAKSLAGKMRESLLNGTTETFKFHIILGKSVAWLRLVKLDLEGQEKSETWEHQTENTSIAYSATTNSVLVRPTALNQLTMLGIIVDAMGYAGNPGILGAEVLKGEGEVNRKNNSEESLNYTLGPQGMLGKLTRSGKGTTSTWEFTNYAPVKSKISIPLHIKQKLEYPNGSEVLKVVVSDFQVSPSISEIALPKFGVVSVKDMRFEPPLEYNACGTLPSDETIAKMVVNPEFRRQFSEDARRGIR